MKGSKMKLSRQLATVAAVICSFFLFTGCQDSQVSADTQATKSDKPVTAKQKTKSATKVSEIKAKAARSTGTPKVVFEDVTTRLRQDGT